MEEAEAEMGISNVVLVDSVSQDGADETGTDEVVLSGWTGDGFCAFTGDRVLRGAFACPAESALSSLP